MSHARGSASIINQRGNWRAAPAPPLCLSLPAIRRAPAPSPCLPRWGTTSSPEGCLAGASSAPVPCSLSRAKCREQPRAATPHPTHEMILSLELSNARALELRVTSSPAAQPGWSSGCKTAQITAARLLGAGALTERNLAEPRGVGLERGAELTPEEIKALIYPFVLETRTIFIICNSFIFHCLRAHYQKEEKVQ